MTALASPGDLATYLQRDLSAAETATATLVLDIASDTIRAYTGQTISLVTGDTVTLDAPCGWRLFLPQLPVTGVTSVTIAGTLLSAVTPDYYWYGDTGIVQLAGRWSTLPKSVVVVYSHGYATIPDAVKGVCLGVAGRMLENPLGLTRQDVDENGQAAADSEGNAVITYRNPLAVGTTLPPPELTAEEKLILDHYRPLVVA